MVTIGFPNGDFAMGRPSPVFVLTSLVVALASTVAIAQTTTRTSPTGTAVTASPPAASNNATGTTTTATGTTNTSTGTTFNNATGALDTGTGPTNNSTGPLVGIIEGTGTTIGSSNIGPTTGSAGGTETTTPVTEPGTSFVIPGTAIDLGALGDTGYGVNANGERVARNVGNGGSNGASGTVVAGPNVFTVPLYDAATRAAAAREQRRKARGEEPRIIGIAPRTDNDLTWQMPDDPVIRY